MSDQIVASLEDWQCKQILAALTTGREWTSQTLADHILGDPYLAGKVRDFCRGSESVKVIPADANDNHERYEFVQQEQPTRYSVSIIGKGWSRMITTTDPLSYIANTVDCSPEGLEIVRDVLAYVIDAGTARAAVDGTLVQVEVL